ncbi:hypothetical protein CRYUN_Cryun08bG0079900 [Craigia yunnanensis]
MASRPIVPPQQPRGAAVHKQTKKNGAGEGRSRRALGDIGNLVNVRGVVDSKPQPQPQIHRPITRSFCAQLLANAQAATAAENNKKNVCVNVDKAPVIDGAAVPKRAAVAPKPVQKKPTAKPKPVEVIEISPDTEKAVEVKEKKDEKKDKVPVNNNKKVTEGEGLSKKKLHTLTSALTARSTAACGIANKPKEEIVDIDEVDANNDLAGVEYVDDIYKFYKSAEFELSPEAFYHTINLIDRFLSVKIVPRRELQLLGMSEPCLLPPNMKKYGPLRLEWTLTVPTPFVFLVRFIKASIPDEKMENMVYFLAELGMMHYETIMFCPSMVAASAVYAARCTLNKTPTWTDPLKFHSGYSEPQLMDCAKLLAYFHSNAAESRLQVIYRKYSNS